MPRKISFINYKGGVGKTSLVVNVAACLAHMGKRILLVDLDTQSNASIWLMRLERWNLLNADPERSLYSIFMGKNSTLESICHKNVIQDKEGNVLLPGLDLIPTTFNLNDLEMEYIQKEGQPAYSVFQQQLAKIEDDYDFILFDCPPNVLRASQCGLFNSGEVYVPANPDALSLIGFTLLVDKLQRFLDRSAGFRKSGMSHPAEIQGIIFNAIKTNTDIQVPKMRMQFRLNQLRNQKRVSKVAKIFPQEIRDAIVVRRAVTLGLPVVLVGQQSKGSVDNVLNDYMNVAKQLNRHGMMIQQSHHT